MGLFFLSGSKILFLDIDGPMIPGRAYELPGQRDELFVKIFDPVAVSLVNHFCVSRNWRIVLHSSWIRFFGGEKTRDHCISQGITKELFHADAWCDENENRRYTRIAMWLRDHPETTHYMILDDEPYEEDNRENIGCFHPADMAKHLALVDFDDGILLSTINKLAGTDARYLNSKNT